MQKVTLDQKCAYFLRSPIRTPSEMPTPVVTNPISPEWDKWIKKQWWHHTNYKISPADQEKISPKMFELRDKLLSFGGSEVCLPCIEEDLANILNRGQFWYADRTTFQKGQPSQCHRNSAYCWDANRDKVVLCTGYALSEDSMWRQHSWCVWLKPRKNRIVETTVGRVAYFGFAMTEEEAERFLSDQW